MPFTGIMPNFYEFGHLGGVSAPKYISAFASFLYVCSLSPPIKPPLFPLLLALQGRHVHAGDSEQVLEEHRQVQGRLL